MSVVEQLAAVCEKHILPAGHEAVVPEPYVPSVPPRWNGALVLGEAQNLSGKLGDYLSWLMAASRRERIRRLGRKGRAGVQPWDDGSLKLAVAASLGLHPDRTAVSNAVLWSLINASGSNRNPSEDLVTRSIVLWAEMLAILRPTRVVAAGSTARKVVSGAVEASRLRAPVTTWALPSPRVLAPLSGMVGEDDLLARFPEVARALAEHPQVVTSKLRSRVILYACLAVSAGRDGLHNIRVQRARAGRAPGSVRGYRRARR